jgi:hypothetical protein
VALNRIRPRFLILKIRFDRLLVVEIITYNCVYVGQRKRGEFLCDLLCGGSEIVVVYHRLKAYTRIANSNGAIFGHRERHRQCLFQCRHTFDTDRKFSSAAYYFAMVDGATDAWPNLRFTFCGTFSAVNSINRSTTAFRSFVS